MEPQLLVRFKIAEAYSFRELIKMIKTSIGASHIRFDISGIKIQEANADLSETIELTISEDNIEYDFYVGNKEVIYFGVSFVELSKAIGDLKMNDAVECFLYLAKTEQQVLAHHLVVKPITKSVGDTNTTKTLIGKTFQQPREILNLEYPKESRVCQIYTRGFADLLKNVTSSKSNVQVKVFRSREIENGIRLPGGLRLIAKVDGMTNASMQDFGFVPDEDPMSQATSSMSVGNKQITIKLSGKELIPDQFNISYYIINSLRQISKINKNTIVNVNKTPTAPLRLSLPAGSYGRLNIYLRPPLAS